MIVARRLIFGIGNHFRTRFAEWVFSMELFTFGFRLLGPGDTFDSSPSYSYMASWWDERHWGVGLCLVAGMRLLSLGINGTFRPFAPFSPVVRAVTAWASSLVWLTLAFGFYRGTSVGTAWSTYGILFVADTALAIIIAREVRPSLRRWRGGRK